ncbi:C-type lectin domain family 2 member F-like isoform X4 [Mobula birostris]|uniref:C-type lectin domain family 2 member F-like isoform X4 n=1 Tax=Mobula birostris TaxID=1983395 RepID=UPI003B288DD4
MDDRETYMNVKITKTDSRSLSRGEPDVSYGKINFKTVSEPRVRTDRDGLNCTYSELNFRKEEHRIDEDEDPPSASGPGVLSNTAPTSQGVQKQESKRNIGNRPSRKICLLCLVTSILIAIVAGLSVHEFPEQTCSKDWIINKDRCYYVSTFETSSSRAVQECLKLDSRLLEICSKDEESFVSHNLAYGNHAYWIGKCKDGNVAWSLLFKVSSGTSECGGCDPNREGFTCDSDRRFMCEKSAALFRDIPEHIQDLCQQPVEAT